MFFVPLIILGVAGLIILLRPWPFFIASGKSRLPGDDQADGRNVAWEFAKWVEHQARTRGLSVRGVARPVSLECRKCRKTSNYFVYPDDVCERCWRAGLKPVTRSVKHNSL
jgi:hypothetical protein